MTELLKAIGAFLGELLKAIFPEILKASKKPKEVKTIGHDEELQDDINKSIEDSIDADA